MGADTTEKNELEPAILGKADLVVADLTGVAVQDIQISKAVCQNLRSGPSSR
jgi:ornithine cyclodeaminase/alanine dehydrogenase-like protein (mu-crystallin family)